MMRVVFPLVVLLVAGCGDPRQDASSLATGGADPAATAPGSLPSAGSRPSSAMPQANPSTRVNTSTQVNTSAQASTSAQPPSAVRDFTMTAAARDGTSADGTYRVRWEPQEGSIPEAEPFAVKLEVVRADGKPLAPAVRVLVDAEMPHHGHGMNLVPTVSKAGPGRFLAAGLLLHMPGKWVFAVDVEEDGIAERTQWFLEVE